MIPRLQPATRRLPRSSRSIAPLRHFFNSNRSKSSRDARTTAERVRSRWSRVLAFHQRPELLNSHTQILQSAFPKKTVLVLLVLGGIAYYSVDISLDEPWHMKLNKRNDVPMSFSKSREDLKAFLEANNQRNALDGNTMGATFDHYNGHFRMGEIGVNGFMMTGEEAEEAGMPVTHGSQIAGNLLYEDRFALGTSPGPGEEMWNYWGVYDGHAGNVTASELQLNLIRQVSYDLSGMQAPSSSLAIARQIQDTFVKIDDEWLSVAKRAASWYPAGSAAALLALNPILSGSCALLACFDPKSSKLRVACTGDSRAVLGRWDAAEGKYVAKPLSADQTGFNKDEVERITAEHPDEEGIIDPKSGRLLGIAVTRAFGDHRWKFDNDLIKQIQIKFWGSSPRPGSKTPPYMTAEPVVTEEDIDRGTKNPAGKADFMIMASDGLWDHISSADAVECVSRWLAAKARAPDGHISLLPEVPPTPYSDDHRLFNSSLTSEPGTSYDIEGSKPLSWVVKPEYFSIEDENAATCLIRNAFGGNRRGLFMGLFFLANGLQRRVMDDTTVLVVFF
ncbi:protein serine/threonine phosphatase 2C, partial [Amniculicola lignicola CBS 123094]